MFVYLEVQVWRQQHQPIYLFLLEGQLVTTGQRKFPWHLLLLQAFLLVFHAVLKLLEKSAQQADFVLAKILSSCCSISATFNNTLGQGLYHPQNLNN